ncbi:hypothetical protein GCM10022280_15280 [Sphingomonas swuensis]|uniref:Tetratricopeptide repeat protein n=1 Tax=Sphingomonas swuensis TaxID=977800 RepID=A0ABP7SVV7_9SPHN
MGLLILAALVIAALAGLWLLGRLRGAALQVAAAALMLGAAGYALQGRPGLAGSPREGGARRPSLPLTEPRQAMLGTFNAGESFLTIADSFTRRGNTGEALGAIRAGLRKYPDSLALRIGYANALVDHSGTISPAARLAFEQARTKAPKHPAPPFFEGLALARSGDREGGLAMFRQALALTPPGTSYRPMIEEGVRVLSAPPAPPMPGPQPGTR